MPLQFTDAGDRHRARVGQEWTIEGVLTALREGSETLVATSDDGDVPLRLDLTERERAVLLDGGMLPHLRSAGRRLVH